MGTNTQAGATNGVASTKTVFIQHSVNKVPVGLVWVEDVVVMSGSKTIRPICTCRVCDLHARHLARIIFCSRCKLGLWIVL